MRIFLIRSMRLRLRLTQNVSYLESLIVSKKTKLNLEKLGLCFQSASKCSFLKNVNMSSKCQ